MVKETNISMDHVIMIRQKLGAKIKEIRLAKAMDQKQLGEAVGVHDTTISKIEAGKFPTAIDMYIKIGIALEFQLELN